MAFETLRPTTRPHNLALVMFWPTVGAGLLVMVLGTFILWGWRRGIDALPFFVVRKNRQLDELPDRRAEVVDRAAELELPIGQGVPVTVRRRSPWIVTEHPSHHELPVFASEREFIRWSRNRRLSSRPMRRL